MNETATPVKATGAWLTRLLIGYALLMVTLLFVFQAQERPDFFNLRFNGFALLSATCLILNLVLFYFVRRQELKSEETGWLIFLLVVTTVFAAAEMMQRLSATPNGAVFWAQVQGLGAGFEPAALFMFAMIYINPKRHHIGAMVTFLTAGALLFFFHANGNLIYRVDPASIKLYPWGYNNDIGSAFILNALWVAIGTLTPVFLIIRFRRRVSQKVIKQQTSLFIIAFLLPIVSAIVTDLLAPAVGWQVPPLGGFFVAGTAGLMLYGLAHYQVFSISPALLSQEVLSNMNESVVVLDKNLSIQLLNEEAEKLLKTSSSLASQKPLSTYFATTYAKTIEDATDKLTKDGDTVAIDNLELGPANNPTYVKASLAQVTEEHGIQGYILVFADVTELKHSYAALEHEKANVEHTVEVRTKELREAQAKLQETDKLKTEFVVLTSHNLRTPLTIIKGNADLLSETELSDKQKQMLLSLESSTKRLGTFVEDLLTISTIESGDKLIKQDVQVSEMLVPLIAEAEELAKTTENSLETNIQVSGLHIDGNPARLQASVRNLLDNAFKFTKNGTVSFSAARETNNLIITVRDTGIGVSEKELPDLFTKFHRGTDTFVFNYEGEGIGLYLSKLIVEEHGGKIAVESKEGVGTTMTITIPLKITTEVPVTN